MVGPPMTENRRRAVRAADAPNAVGPYSQAVCTARLVFTSGQIPLDPKTGQLEAGPIDQQTRRVMENLRAVLTAAGATFSDVVKSTVYLTDLGDFATVNAVYAGYFSSEPPARSTVQVAALPLGARVEIEMVAERAGS
jgi:2-iminobutanoate/2-iminopropanoate deaminase